MHVNGMTLNTGPNGINTTVMGPYHFIGLHPQKIAQVENAADFKATDMKSEANKENEVRKTTCFMLLYIRQNRCGYFICNDWPSVTLSHGNVSVGLKVRLQALKNVTFTKVDIHGGDEVLMQLLDQGSVTVDM